MQMNTTCEICLEPVLKRIDLFTYKNSKCNHIFHVKCATIWNTFKAKNGNSNVKLECPLESKALYIRT